MHSQAGAWERGNEGNLRQEPELCIPRQEPGNEPQSHRSLGMSHPKSAICNLKSQILPPFPPQYATCYKTN
jgi:hypothetical protein